MADYRRLIPFVLRWEGGYVDDPLDRGGATYRGVTLRTYATYRRGRGLPPPSKADLRRMTDAEWMEIFKLMYWDRWQADRIRSQSVANICVDWLWASGSHGIKRVQRLLAVPDDGLVGPMTLEALNARAPEQLFAEIRAARVCFVKRIVARDPSQKRFERGWLNRLAALRYEA